MARELQHVVGVAGLRAFSTEVMRGLLFREEGLAVAVAADDERPVVRRRDPRRTARCPDSARSPVSSYSRATPMILGIWVLACTLSSGSIPCASGSRIRRCSKRLGGRADNGVAGHREQVGEHLVHAAELRVERALLLLVGRAGPTLNVDPVGLLRQDFERLRVAGQEVRVQQPGHDLVNRVVGRPDALPRVHPVEELFGKRRQIAGMELRGLGRLHLRPAR